MRASRLAWVLALVLSLSGCARHVPLKDPALLVTLPERHSASGRVQAPDRWWTAFEDPRPRRPGGTGPRREPRALRGLPPSRTVRGHRPPRGAPPSAPRWISRRVRPAPSPLFFFGGPPRAAYVTQVDLSASASYEVDLWGRLRAAAQAGSPRRPGLAGGPRDPGHGAREPGRRDLVFPRGEPGPARPAEGAARPEPPPSLDLLELRFGQGLANSLDVYQQRQQVASIEAQLPQVEGGLATLRHQLAVLQGLPPRSAAPSPTTTALPILPPLPATGLPADLLVRRPDVRARMLRLRSADRQVAGSRGRRPAPARPLAEHGLPRRRSGRHLLQLGVEPRGSPLPSPSRRGTAQGGPCANARRSSPNGSISSPNPCSWPCARWRMPLEGERHRRLYLERLEEQLRLAERTLEEAPTSLPERPERLPARAHRPAEPAGAPANPPRRLGARPSHRAYSSIAPSAADGPVT